jgi:hypothetical protein
MCLAGACSSSSSPTVPPDQDASTAEDSSEDAKEAMPKGCPTTESATVTGTVNGVALDAKDAVAFVPTLEIGYGEIYIFITSYPNACSEGQEKPESTVFQFQYLGGLSEAAPLGKVCAGSGFGSCANTATFENLDATCSSDNDAGMPTKTSASSGTVDFTCIDGHAVVGTFDIMFGTDHVTGSFDAPLCNSTLSTSCGH